MPEDQTLTEAFKQIASLRASLNDAHRTITHMQKFGGFADSKTLSQRSTRLEERTQVLERDAAMVKDLTSHIIEFQSRHLIERHEIGENDQAPDSIYLRKAMKILKEWASKRVRGPNKIQPA